MSSRLPGFHRLPLAERIRVLAIEGGLTRQEVELLESDEPLERGTAELMIENAIGVFGMPLGIATNFQVNGRDYLVPMVTEEPSIVAAASNAARLAREAGGILAEADPSLMIGQIQVIDVADPVQAVARVEQAAAWLVEKARLLQPRMVERGGGTTAVEAEVLDDESVLIHVVTDVGDAMGANAINTLVEDLAPEIEKVTGGTANLKILSNLSDRRLVRARMALPEQLLETKERSGADIARRIARASDFAAASPHRAATHNKGVMNGIDAVVLATGNDWRAIEAGAHAYAAKSGRYQPLATWRVAEGCLHGLLEIPLAVGTVGERIRINPRARIALKLLGVSGARELAMVMGAVGLAQNFAALRAMANEGIQRGHMALHRRGVEAQLATAEPERGVVP